ncbi:unnamed protein product [Alopecurus aequalis]
MLKTLSNIKMTVICGFITILVLRGTIGIHLVSFSGGDAAAEGKVFDDIERVLREIRSDTEPDDEDDQLVVVDSTTTMHVEETTKNYTLGPRITHWDAQRKQWLSRNPGLPCRDALGKPKILLVTGSPPGPCHNPAGDHYLLKSTKNKIDYCRIHGIELVQSMALLDRELTEYWSKFALLRRLMLSHPEVEWVWWMDNDALFTDMAFQLPLARYESSNLVIHGYDDLLWKQRSWIALNAGIFLLRNCQWSMELLDEWVLMGPKGHVREEAGKKGRWMDKVYVEDKYYLHGYWAGLVDRYEEMMEKHHPGLGDHRWPFITHFVGCKPCGRYGDYPVEQCLRGMERAFNFADNQVLRLYGFRHRSLESPKVKPVANRTTASPLLAKEAALHMDAKFDT